MTSYRVYDNYQEEIITGIIIKVLTSAFLLKSDNMYYCIPHRTNILQEANQLYKRQVKVKCTGLVELYSGNLSRLDKHVYEFIVKELEAVEVVNG